MNTTWRTALALLLASMVALDASADDTEVYLRRDFGGSGAGQPLVMFTLDLRPNLGSRVCQRTECDSLRPTYLPATGDVSFFELLRAVLRKVTHDMAVELEDVKVGLMINHNDTSTGTSNGGYVLQGFDADKQKFHDKLTAIPPVDDPVTKHKYSHPFQGEELYFELFRYLTGQGIYNGHKGYTDYGDSNKNDNLNVDNPGTTTFDDRNLQWDTNIEDGANYISPLLHNCSRVFMINFMFGVSKPENASDDAIAASKAHGGMNVDLQGKENDFPTIIRFMRDADLGDGDYGSVGNLEGVQNVTSYFFVDQSQLQLANQKGYASAGGTNTALPLSTNPDELIQQLKDIFKQILSISTSFVSATVPSNLFNRVDTLEHVFFGLFQPEEAVRWNGNLKRFKIDQDTATGNLKVVDVEGTEAISATDGRIKDDVLSFWTNASAFDVVYADTSKGEVSGKDGRSVGRGGAGQRIPGFLGGTPGLLNSDTGARQLYTEPEAHTNGTATLLIPLNADDVTADNVWEWLRLESALGTAPWTTAVTYSAASLLFSLIGDPPKSVSDSVLGLDLLKFARGLDVKDEYSGTETQAHPWAVAGSSPRPWLFGDPIHSKPTPVNYGTTGGYSVDNQALHLLVASNDGYLRMFRNNTTGGIADGQEVWAFMPRRLLGNLKRFADNPAAATPLYGLDGGIAVYTHDENSDNTIDPGTDNVYAYVGMRRGGKGYYALDITVPEAPKILWSIYKGDASGNFDELGFTFSAPVVGQLDWGQGKKPVVIFAGGYDINKDDRATDNRSNAALGTLDTEGNAIFIVDASNGQLVWKHAASEDCIPSTVTAVDTDGDGLTDRIYVGDTGGRVWRADLAGLDGTTHEKVVDDPTLWTLTAILSVGRHASQPDRRFFHAPDFVQASDSAGDFDAVVIGSGDREAPRDTNVQNQFYVFKDRNLESGNPPGTTKEIGALHDLSDPSTVYDSGAFPSGWYFDLGSSASGEKTLTSPLTYFGRIYFSTYLPNETPGDRALECAPSEGLSQSYVVDLQDASGVLNFNTANDVAGDTGNDIVLERSTITGSGLPSDPVFISYKGNTYITPGNIPQTEQFRHPVFSRPLWQIYWYERE